MADLSEAEEETWCNGLREQVIAYLARERLTHGRVGEWPAWHLHPYVTVWAIESAELPDSVGWWAIAGDLPTDYVTCGPERHPREGVRDIALRWEAAAATMAAGCTPEGFQVGRAEQASDLAPLLASRARALLRLTEDNEIWPE